MIIEFVTSLSCWCLRVGWASLQVRIASPVLLVPGNGQERMFYQAHAQHAWNGVVGVPNSQNLLTQVPGLATSIGLLANNAVNFLQQPALDGLAEGGDLGSPKAENTFHQNALTLQAWSRPIARAYGVDALHYVGHSQGGQVVVDLAIQCGRLSSGSGQPRVLSVTTLGAPHLGSPLADFVEAQSQVYSLGLTFEGTSWTESLRLEAAALALATTPATRTMTRAYTYKYHVKQASLYPIDVVYGAMSSDADQPPIPDQITSQTEYSGFVPFNELVRGLPEFASTSMCNLMYHMVGKNVQFYIHHPVFIEDPVIEIVHTSQFPEDNDIFVTSYSALGGDPLPVTGRRTLAAMFGSRIDHCAGARARDHARLGIDGPMLWNVRTWVIEAETKYGAFK